jgi:hypothetical protein
MAAAQEQALVVSTDLAASRLQGVNALAGDTEASFDRLKYAIVRWETIHSSLICWLMQIGITYSRNGFRWRETGCFGPGKNVPHFIELCYLLSLFLSLEFH